jgi:hypothetical protein
VVRFLDEPILLQFAKKVFLAHLPKDEPGRGYPIGKGSVEIKEDDAFARQRKRAFPENLESLLKTSYRYFQSRIFTFPAYAVNTKGA